MSSGNNAKPAKVEFDSSFLRRPASSFVSGSNQEEVKGVPAFIDYKEKSPEVLKPGSRMRVDHLKWEPYVQDLVDVMIDLKAMDSITFRAYKQIQSIIKQPYRNLLILHFFAEPRLIASSIAFLVSKLMEDTGIIDENVQLKNYQVFERALRREIKKLNVSLINIEDREVISLFQSLLNENLPNFTHAAKERPFFADFKIKRKPPSDNDRLNSVINLQESFLSEDADEVREAIAVALVHTNLTWVELEDWVLSNLRGSKHLASLDPSNPHPYMQRMISSQKAVVETLKPIADSRGLKLSERAWQVCCPG